MSAKMSLGGEYSEGKIKRMTKTKVEAIGGQKHKAKLSDEGWFRITMLDEMHK